MTILDLSSLKPEVKVHELDDNCVFYNCSFRINEDTIGSVSVRFPPLPLHLTIPRELLDYNYLTNLYSHKDYRELGLGKTLLEIALGFSDFTQRPIFVQDFPFVTDEEAEAGIKEPVISKKDLRKFYMDYGFEIYKKNHIFLVRECGGKN